MNDSNLSLHNDTRSPDHDSSESDSTTHITAEQHLNIPQELKDRPQWVVRIGKVPYQPRLPEEKANNTDSSTWGAFEEAIQALGKHKRLDGIGYVPSEDDPYVVFDFDHCIHPETGDINDVVSGLIEDLDGYTEISPSGTGLRVIVRAKKPGKRCSTKKTPWDGEFALFEHSKYFTITGRVLGGRTIIREAQEAVERAYHAAFGEDEKPSATERDGLGNDLSDAELLGRASRSKKGDRFRRHHYDGDASGYESRSEADFAHLADLCFWTGGDEERMVDLFSRSALYVPKKGMRYVRLSARKAIITHRGGYFTRPKDRSEEVRKAIERFERDWWNEKFPGIAGNTDASLDRVLIRAAKRIGTVDEEGHLNVSLSVRQFAEIAECHVNTVLNYTKRGKEAGRLDKDDYRAKEEDSAVFKLLARPSCDTLKNTELLCLKEGVTRESRYPVADLTTMHWRGGRAHVGKGRERTLCAGEAFGPQTEEELAERRGWSRSRDLRKRHLEPLAELGLMENRGGVWVIPQDYAERQEEVKKMPYSTIQLRAKRIRSVEGLMVTVVEESGCVASEEARKEADVESNKHQRKTFRWWLAEKRKAAKEREAARSTTPPTVETPEPEPEPVEVAWPEVVDGVVIHDPDCVCAEWCADGPTGVEEAA